MATVKKSSKIDLYKFVPSGATSTKSNPMVRTMVSNVAAVNNLGKTVNSIAGVVVDIKKTNLARLEQERKNRVKFKPDYTVPKKRKSMFSFLNKIKKGRIPGFLESLLNLLGGLLGLFVVLPIMKWLADPNNQKKVETFLVALGHVFKAIAGWAKFGVTNALDGLYNMLRDDATWMERLGGLAQFLIGWATLAVPMMWLNPFRIAKSKAELVAIGKFVKTGLVAAAKDFAALAASPIGFLFTAGLLFTAGGWLTELFPWMAKSSSTNKVDENVEAVGLMNTIKQLEEEKAKKIAERDKLGWHELWRRMDLNNEISEINNQIDRLKGEGKWKGRKIPGANEKNLEGFDYKVETGQISEKDLETVNKLNEKIEELSDSVKDQNLWSLIGNTFNLNNLRTNREILNLKKQIHEIQMGVPEDQRTQKKAFGRFLNNFSQGGWISGPQSGYPVSLDGSNIDFIGHGTEYVARGKSDGSAYIVPFDTKATRNNPNLLMNRLDEAKRMGYHLGGLERDAGGLLANNKKDGNKTLTLGWTGGDYSNTKGRYHTVFGGSGKRTQNIDYGDVAKRGRSSNIALGIAAMGGKGWEEFPPTSSQLIGMMQEAAKVGMGWGMEGKDVTRKNVMTEAEAAGARGPVAWGGTGEVWDLFKLKKNDPDGSGGDRLRQMMRNFMQNPGKRKAEGYYGNRMNNNELNLLRSLILAEARGEGVTGMALVARSVLQRQALIRQGGNPGLFMSAGQSLTDIIYGDNQYQPTRDGSINNKWSAGQLASAQKAIDLALNTERFRNQLRAAGYDDTTINKLLASTGFRGVSAKDDPSQNVNRTKFGKHIFNTAGNKSATDLIGTETSNRRYASSPGATYNPANISGRENDGQIQSMNNNTVPNLPRGKTGQPSVTINRTSDARGIKKASEERNKARMQMNKRTLAIVQEALAAVEKQNSQSRSWAQQANAQAQHVLASANQPRIVGGGGGRSRGGGGSSGNRGIWGTAVSMLNSFSNPLKGLFS